MGTFWTRPSRARGSSRLGAVSLLQSSALRRGAPRPQAPRRPPWTSAPAAEAASLHEENWHSSRSCSVAACMRPSRRSGRPMAASANTDLLRSKRPVRRRCRDRLRAQPPSRSPDIVTCSPCRPQCEPGFACSQVGAPSPPLERGALPIDACPVGTGRSRQQLGAGWPSSAMVSSAPRLSPAELTPGHAVALWKLNQAKENLALFALRPREQGQETKRGNGGRIARSARK